MTIEIEVKCKKFKIEKNEQPLMFEYPIMNNDTILQKDGLIMKFIKHMKLLQYIIMIMLYQKQLTGHLELPQREKKVFLRQQHSWKNS
jgi:hypothetical protein